MKLLVWAAGGLAAALILIQVFIRPWLADYETLDKKTVLVETRLKKAKRIYARRKKIEKDWKTVQSDLQDPERPGKSKEFDFYVRNLIEQAIKDSKRLPNVGFKKRPEQTGDFAQTILDVKDAQFKTKEWARFLAELDMAKGFLKVRSLSIRSKIERSKQIRVVNVSLSTIDYVPVKRRKPRKR